MPPHHRFCWQPWRRHQQLSCHQGSTATSSWSGHPNRVQEGSSISGMICTSPVYATVSAAWFCVSFVAVNASVCAVAQGFPISLMSGAKVQIEEENITVRKKNKVAKWPTLSRTALCEHTGLAAAGRPPGTVTWKMHVLHAWRNCRKMCFPFLAQPPAQIRPQKSSSQASMVGFSNQHCLWFWNVTPWKAFPVSWGT